MVGMTGSLRAPAAEGEWRPQGPYSLPQTLGVVQRGTHDPTIRVAGPAAWLCFRHDGGPVTLRLDLASARGSTTEPVPAVLRWRAWGEGAQHAGFADAVVRLAGGDDDWAEFDAADFAASLPPRVRRARRDHPGLRLPATGRVFDALMPAVLEQKVTTIEALFAWRYIAGRFGDEPPSPAVAHGGDSVLPEGMRLPPTPHQLRRIPSWDWHAARVDSARSRTLLRAAESAPGLARLAEQKLEARPGVALQSLPGIGPWTAAEVLQRSHGDPDSVSVGDYHLAGFVGEALTGKRTDDAGMLDLLRPWHGHRQRVVRLLAASGFRKQARGPRLAPRDYRRI
ncbi:3-methyladenine DNA glycosylase/8-oxoguanine DNA glycosylase [Zhihengliuella halotolerans]|uniref:3-methyladenine DNA glycosylase/8-oxoguanine DNA glycosylase n=2 Tax=Zhihengliuella halotolerans TaxID=370736 RepID=A0A4Q8A9E4_9MICC|nr:3-methyladenine DNA glycosylase/8-oxoguanine DNA glycosylase [Zhihengliuella halotolerans]